MRGTLGRSHEQLLDGSILEIQFRTDVRGDLTQEALVHRRDMDAAVQVVVVQRSQDKKMGAGHSDCGEYQAPVLSVQSHLLPTRSDVRER